MRKLLTSVTFVSAALLAGCGGGGNDPPPVTGPFNADQADRNLAVADREFDLSGTGSDGRKYRMVIHYEKLPSDVFPYTGKAALRRRTTTQVFVDGIEAVSAAGIDYFDGKTYDVLGGTFGDDTSICGVVTAAARPAIAAAVGDGGPLFEGEVRSPCSSAGSTVVSTTAQGWSVVQADGMAFYCYDESSNEDGLSSESHVCHHINEDGDLSREGRVLLKVRVPGQPEFSVTGKNY